MNIKELRDLLEDRSAQQQPRPVPLADLRHRIRRARLRRRVAVTGLGVAGAVAVAAVITVPGHDDDAASTTGSATPTAKPPMSPADRRNLDRKLLSDPGQIIELQSRYWWHVLPGRTDLSWPREDTVRLEIRPGGRSLGLYSTCKGFESNVSVTITLNGATFPEEVGHGRSTGLNCFTGGLYALKIPASTAKVTVTVVAHRLAGPASAGWPASRPRTWSFAFYDRGAKVPVSAPAVKAAAGLPDQVMSVDQAEVEDTRMRLFREYRQGKTRSSAPN